MVSFVQPPMFVSNFRAGTVEVYDANFKPVRLPGDGFAVNGDDDGGADRVPKGFAPFNVQNIGGSLFATYAKQDAARHDNVAGDGLGYVEIFTLQGNISATSNTAHGSIPRGEWCGPREISALSATRSWWETLEAVGLLRSRASTISLKVS
jgi:uncharacterized protein (TIGR03118 family)